MPGVVLDMQGTQNPEDAERGIGRYLRELALALAVLPSRSLSSLVVNADEPLPAALEPLLVAHRWQTQETLTAEGWSAYHVGSLFDVAKPLDRVLPRLARRPDKQLIVTLYDLIPHLFPGDYLADPVSHARYTARLEALRRADSVLAISATTATDAVEHVGVAESRVHLVGTGVSAHFRPPVSKQACLAQAQLRFPSLREGYLLVTGAGDPRKNQRGLLDAYSRLPGEMRANHQLVIVGRLNEPELRTLQLLAAQRRILDRVIFTGYISDDELLLLYQVCDLFVFPSHYEGFGLPVVEALASGAAVIAADSSSLREIIRDPAARFALDSPAAMSDRMREALCDPEHLDRLRQPDAGSRWSWEGVATRVETAYEAALGRSRRQRSRQRRRRVAWISPLPPQRSRAAPLSASVIQRCPSDVTVDAYHSAAYRGESPGGPIALRPLRAFAHVERLLGDYDAIVYCIDGRPYSSDPITLAHQRPGVVIGLDLRLATVYDWRDRNRLEPEGWPSLVERCEAQYGEGAAALLERKTHSSVEDLDRRGILMSRELLETSHTTFVQSEYARGVALLEAPGATGRVEVLPWATPPAASLVTHAAAAGANITAFGWVDSSRQPEKLVSAMRRVLRKHPRARLAFVGPIDATDRQRLYRLAQELEVGHALTITGALDEQTYREWFGCTTLAVQLRSVSNGESPSTVAECLSNGVPAVVTEIGAIRELPDGCVHPHSRDSTPDELAAEISELLGDRRRRADLAYAGRTFARENPVERFAELVWEHVLA